MSRIYPEASSESVKTAKQSRQTYKIKDFSSKNKRVQSVHDFFDRRVPVPPMHVQYVDVRCAKLFQTLIYADMHRLDTVSGVVHVLFNRVVTTLIVSAVLSTTVVISLWE